jgi:hypothetical protein
MRSKKHKRIKPSVILVTMLVLALAAMSTAYGLWSKTLIIEGTVNTGKVDAKWTLVTCTEFYPWPDGGFTGEFEGKDVGWTTAVIDSVDDQIMHVTVHNGYPSYAVDCQVHFENDGTIPVIVRGTTIVPVSGNLTNCTLTGFNSKTLECDQLTVVFVDNLSTQLHPGDRAASSLTLHVEQPADQDSTYKFDVLVCMAQWNEAPNAAECFAASP